MSATAKAKFDTVPKDKQLQYLYNAIQAKEITQREFISCVKKWTPEPKIIRVKVSREYWSQSSDDYDCRTG